jgi:hypothetical protein
MRDVLFICSFAASSREMSAEEPIIVNRRQDIVVDRHSRETRDSDLREFAEFLASSTTARAS